MPQLVFAKSIFSRFPLDFVTELPLPEPKADWIAWTLQFIAGAFVGAFLGLFAVSGRGRFTSVHLTIDLHLLPLYLVATSLLGAGMASLMGDKLWIGNNYRCIPSDEIQQSPLSSAISYATCILGFLLLIYVLGAQLGYLPKHLL